MTDDPEAEASHKLATVIAPAIEAISRRLAAIVQSVPEGSPMAGDDRQSAPFQISHAAVLALSHALDNLEALRIGTVVGEHPNLQVLTRPYAAYPTLRAAFENASIACWLLGPGKRYERLTRRFRLILADAASRDAVARLAGFGETTTHGERLARIRPVVEKWGLEISEKTASVGMRQIVRGAAVSAGREPDFYESIWRLLSGATHGDLWASVMVTEHEQVGEIVGGVVTARITSPVRNIANLTMLTLGVAGDALALYERRCKPYMET